MKAIITNQPSVDVVKIEKALTETHFRLADGRTLRVGVTMDKLESLLTRYEGVRGIDLSQPPSTQTEIFYTPFMERHVYDALWPVLREHRAVRKAFKRNKTLQRVTLLSFEELRGLPLRAYVSHPFGLYLYHPYSFRDRAADPKLPDGAADEYVGDFQDGQTVVNVFINIRTKAVTVK